MQITEQSQVNPLGSIHFPFPYRVRTSERARRLNLRILPERGIVLTIPRRISKANALHFLEQHIDWVRKHTPEHLQAIQPIILPEMIDLPILGQWRIRYEMSLGRSLLLEQPEQTLVYCGPDDDQKKLTKLRQWVQHKAANYLTERLRIWSEHMQLPFSELSFRTQRSLWGSCNRARKISLNYKLIFLESKLIDYVLIHELAHLRHLNHSDAFWQLVANFCPDYPLLKNKLRNSEIPTWFYMLPIS